MGSGPLYTVLAGEAVGVSDVLVKYTYFGDADLSGMITSNDYFQIDTGFLANKTGWINCDFDYNGVINSNDYFLIDNAFLRLPASGPTVSVEASDSGTDIRALWVTPRTPETPSTGIDATLIRELFQ